MLPPDSSPRGAPAGTARLRKRRRRIRLVASIAVLVALIAPAGIAPALARAPSHRHKPAPHRKKKRKHHRRPTPKKTDCTAAKSLTAHCVYTVATNQGYSGRATVTNGTISFLSYAGETCDNGQSYTGTVSGTFPLDKNGYFNATGSLAEGQQFAVSGEYVPKASPPISGGLSAGYDYTDVYGNAVHCTSPEVHWTAINSGH